MEGACWERSVYYGEGQLGGVEGGGERNKD